MNVKSPLRLGTLNLLVVVIALCLAVLAVLSLSAAHASSVLVTRQQNTLQQTYGLDAVAASYEALLDQKLADLPSGDTDALQAFSPEDLALLKQKCQQLASVDAQNIRVEAQQVALEDVWTFADPSQQEGLKDEGIQARFTTNTGYALDCLWAITDENTLEVMQWKTAKTWTEDPQQETLWQGR